MTPEEGRIRLSDAEREQAAAELGDHYAEGRLTVTEHGDRLDQIWLARTRSDLLPIFADLPSRYAAAARPPTRTAGPSSSFWRPGPMLALLAVLLVLTVVTRTPLILVGLLVWCFWFSRRRRHTPHRW